MVHSAHNESVFLIKQTSCKGKESCRLCHCLKFQLVDVKVSNLLTGLFNGV